MNDGKEGGVCADAQGQRANGDDREAGPLEEHAQGKSDILQPAVEQRQAPLLAILFLGLLHAAEFALCGLACRLGREAAPLMLRNQHVKMRLKFGIEIALDPLLAEKTVQPRSKGRQPLHLMPLGCRRAAGS